MFIMFIWVTSENYSGNLPESQADKNQLGTTMGKFTSQGKLSLQQLWKSIQNIDCSF